MKKSTLRSALEAIPTVDIKQALLELESLHSTGVIPNGVFNGIVQEISSQTHVPDKDVRSLLESYLLQKVAFAWANDKADTLWDTF